MSRNKYSGFSLVNRIFTKNVSGLFEWQPLYSSFPLLFVPDKHTNRQTDNQTDKRTDRNFAPIDTFYGFSIIKWFAVRPRTKVSRKKTIFVSALTTWNSIIFVFCAFYLIYSYYPLSTYLCIYSYILYIYASSTWFIYPAIHTFIHLYTPHPSIHLSIHLSIYKSIFVYLFICLPDYSFAYLSIYYST